MSQYVCPMHPEETSEDPNARCSQCGMALEPVKDGESGPEVAPTDDQPAQE